MLINVLIQSNQFETADNLIQESRFCADGTALRRHLITKLPVEKAVLRAGIATILQDYDKGIAILKEAEALHADLQSSIPSLPPLTPPFEPITGGKVTSSPPDEEIMIDPKLDNGKRKEYSYREQMASCLVRLSLLLL